MNISSSWRDRRGFMPPMYYPYASYSTDAKNNMSKTFAEEMFLNNFHLGPDALRKNLADTIVTQENMAPKNSKKYLEKEDLRVKEESQMHEDASRMSGLSNFFSGVLNVISNAVFSKRKPDYSSNSGQNMALPSIWQDAKLTDENKNVQAENLSDEISSEFFVSDMSDCRSAAAHCQSKLDQVRLLLGADKPAQCSLRVRRRPKKVFVEPSHVEDCFEDAFSPEDFENLANDSFIEFYSPVCYHDQTFHEIDSPKCKIEAPGTPTVASEPPVAKSSEVSDSQNMVSGKYIIETDIPNVMQVLKLVPENTEVGNGPNIVSVDPSIATDNVPDTITTSNVILEEPKKKVVDSCEDKMNKLKLLLQGRCKKTKYEKPVEIEPVVTLTLDPKPQPQPLVKLPPRPKPSTTVKDKRFKNPNRTCDKRRKSRMKKAIEDDLMFANEISSEDLSSSFENSPSTNNMETYIGSRVKHVQNPENKPTQPKPVPKKDFFDEVAGCFQSGSLESNDSFQIVFHDSPRNRRSSDCESEDSFIVFEDSTDSCYTSNDVFGESDEELTDSEEYDSDSDASDSGCGVFNLNGSLSKSVSNLADDSLYVDHSEDEVDCANIEDLTICDSVSASDIGDTGVSKGLLLDDRKKLLRKSLPAKRVRFSPNPPKVHVMRVWLYAAKQTRCRYWQQFAVDRERFKRRIADVDMAVSWVLKPQHRSRVMFQRFMPWWNAQKRKEIAEKKEREAQEKMEEEERLKNVEIEKQNTELHGADSNLDGDNTNTDNNSKLNGAGDENLDINDSYKTLINTVDNSEVDTRAGVNNNTAIEKTNANNNSIVKEIDCHNSTNIEKHTKEDLNEKLYNGIVPFSDKKLETDYVSLHTEYVKLNT